MNGLSLHSTTARSEPPNADNVLLTFMIGVLLLLSIFTYCMYCLMQPTVLANAGAAEFKREMSVAIILPARSIIDQIQQSEVAAALQENEIQGLQSVAHDEPPVDSAQKLVKARPRAPAKSKRVAKVQRPDISPFAQRAWASAPMRGRSFGGFGSWYR